jgi:hypothetical protein
MSKRLLSMLPYDGALEGVSLLAIPNTFYWKFKSKRSIIPLEPKFEAGGAGAKVFLLLIYYD